MIECRCRAVHTQHQYGILVGLNKNAPIDDQIENPSREFESLRYPSFLTLQHNALAPLWSITLSERDLCCCAFWNKSYIKSKGPAAGANDLHDDEELPLLLR